MIRPLAFLLVAAATLLSAGPGAARAADRALVIGISAYRSLPEKMFLEGPKNDIRLIEGLLKDKLGFAAENIRVLRDSEATRAAILATIDDWLIAGTEPGDRAYLFFSGHGLQVTDHNGDEEDGLDEALSTFDIAAGDGDWTNVILDDDIDAVLARLKDRKVSLVIDACHSGTISRTLSTAVGEAMASARFLPRPSARPAEAVKTRGLRVDVAVLDTPERVKESGIEAWSAASSYQIAWDDTRLPPEERHGVFTSSYVAGHDPASADGNGNGLVSNAELLEYVKKQSQAYCAVQPECKALDPQLEVNYALLGESVAPTGGGEDPATAADPLTAVGDILGKSETGDVTIALSPPHLKNGDAFRITVTSGRAGQLFLYDIAADSTATQIFPNEAAQKITALSPGVPLTIPDDYYGFDFEAEGTGESLLVAIVVADDVDLAAVAPASAGLSAELDARSAVAGIAGALSETWTRDAENRSVDWSLGLLRYKID